MQQGQNNGLTSLIPNLNFITTANRVNHVNGNVAKNRNMIALDLNIILDPSKFEQLAAIYKCFLFSYPLNAVFTLCK